MLVLLSACTFSPGSAFSELDRGSLGARFDPGARDLGDGTAVSDRNVLYRVDRFEATLAAVELQELQGAGGVEFDPAHPPPGYLLCHGGHCDAADGSIKSYAEVEAELAGGGASLVPVAGWSELEDPLDLLAGIELDLGPPDDPLLPEVELTRVVVRLVDVQLEGELGERNEKVRFALALPGAELAADLGFTVDRNAPPAVALSLDWPVDGTLFDGVELDPLLDLDDAGVEAALADPVLDHLLQNPLEAELVEIEWRE